MFDFRLVGHRGDPAHFLENTISSILGAIKCGVTAVEVDVRSTSDGILIACHDQNLKRVWGRSMDVNRITFRELRGVELRGDRIPTLSEVAGAVKKKASLDLDIKVSGYEEAILKVIEADGNPSRTLLTSFDSAVLSRLRSLSSNCRTGLIEAGAFDDAIEVASSLGAESILPHAPDVRPEPLSVAKDNGLLVVPWTVNETLLAKHLLGLGVDGIVTDDPCALAPLVLNRDESWPHCTKDS